MVRSDGGHCGPVIDLLLTIGRKVQNGEVLAKFGAWTASPCPIKGSFYAPKAGVRMFYTYEIALE
jgi:hypothetical protein